MSSERGAAPVALPTAELASATGLSPAARAGFVASGWRRRYALVLLLSDVLSASLSVAIVQAAGFGNRSALSVLAFAGLVVAVELVWLFALFITGCYEVRELSLGVEEVRRVLRATAMTVGLVCVIAVLTHGAIPRRNLIANTLIALSCLAAGRFAVRAWISRRRRHGNWADRVVVVGSAVAVHDLISVLVRKADAGLSVVAACTDDQDQPSEIAGVPVVGAWSDAIDAAAVYEADIVAIAGAGSGQRAMRELSWSLERTGRQLVTATEPAEIASSRIDVRPVDGLPLVWVEHPRFTGPIRFIKRLLDLAGALVALLLAGPFMLMIGLLIKLTSSGPIIFKHRRLGKDGLPISVLKFRTMVADAEARQDEIQDLNSGSNLLYFKVVNDPRVTKVGRVLRRLSLDELPQLLNVVGGSMSLVGPRPLPGQFETCGEDYRRRLMVRPGITGLWQVSGRSDLTTEEALRLDLYYVENWTLGFDFAIIFRTAWAVIRSRGAY